MRKLYEKSEMTLSIILIAIYVVSQSVAQSIDKAIGVQYSASALLVFVLTIILAAFIVKNGLAEKYGLCKSKAPARSFLWFIPLAAIASRNLWLGTAQSMTGADLACYLFTMLCVGFVEEVLFRGMLFRAIEKSSHTQAVIISSITFGLGHIINMLNGIQSDWFVSICQIVGAIIFGFLFVMIFDKGGSLWPCIIAHSVNNMLSIFADDAQINANPQLRLITLGIFAAMVALYLLWLNHSLPRKAN